MAELPISSPYRSRPTAPVTDAERDQLGARLNEAYAEGRLDADDYHARLDTLFAAHTLAELVPVVEGLLPAATYDTPAIVPTGAGAPGEVSAARDVTGVSMGVLLGVVGAVLVVAVLFLLLIGNA